MSLRNRGIATSRPLGERSELFYAAKRPTARAIWNTTKDFFESLRNNCARMLLKWATGRWKIETKRILNPSPISKFVANSLFCSHFSFSCSAFLLFVASNCVSQFFFVVPTRLRRETSKWAWRFMGVVNTQSRIDSLTVDKIQRVGIIAIKIN